MTDISDIFKLTPKPGAMAFGPFFVNSPDDALSDKAHSFLAEVAKAKEAFYAALVKEWRIAPDAIRRRVNVRTTQGDALMREEVYVDLRKAGECGLVEEGANVTFRAHVMPAPRPIRRNG